MRSLILMTMILISTSSCTRRPLLGTCFIANEVQYEYYYYSNGDKYVWKVESYVSRTIVKLAKPQTLHSKASFNIKVKDLKENYIKVDCN